jgi:hypothetical protein
MTDAEPQIPDFFAAYLAALPPDQAEPVYRWVVSAAPSNYVSLAIQGLAQPKGNDVYE